MILSSPVSRVAFAALLAFAATACTDDQPKVDEVVKTEKAEQKETKDFKIDENGKVVFKAEVVYFKFDDHTLTQEGMAQLDSLAAYLKSNPGQKLEIDGHCDERGAPEYNLALGERRALSVKTYLANVGIDASRLDTKTYGKERPAVEGSGEEAWAKNRRAEFTLTGAQSE